MSCIAWDEVHAASPAPIAPAATRLAGQR